MTEELTHKDMAFSSMYTAISQATGLPRNEVKLAIIKTFLGLDAGETWQKIVEHQRTEAKKYGFTE